MGPEGGVDDPAEEQQPRSLHLPVTKQLQRIVAGRTLDHDREVRHLGAGGRIEGVHEPPDLARDVLLSDEVDDSGGGVDRRSRGHTEGREQVAAAERLVAECRGEVTGPHDRSRLGIEAVDPVGLGRHDGTIFPTSRGWA